MAEIKEIKYTQKQMFEAVIKMANGEKTEIPMDKVIEFAEKKLEQLANKSGKTSAKKNDEQEAFMEIIRDVLAESSDVNGMTNAEMLKDERIADFPWADNKRPTSSSRLTAYLTRMGEPTAEHPERLGDIKRTVVKKTPYFSLA